MPRTWKSSTKQVVSTTQTIITTTTITTKVRSAYSGKDKKQKRICAESNTTHGLSWNSCSSASVSEQGSLIIGGYMDGKNMFIIRAEYAGGVYPGEILSGNNHAWFGYNGTIMTTQGDVQCLTGNSNGCRWVAVSGPCTMDKLGATPVEGGWEADGTRYLIAQVCHTDATHCGKVKWNDIASFAFSNGENRYENYNVLVFA